MGYSLQELLAKLGSPEVNEKKESRWYYTDQTDSEYGGFADIRLNSNDKILTVDLYHRKRKGEVQFQKENIESFSMQAEMSGEGLFNVTSLAFDGEVYNPKDKSMLELGCSVFYSRAVEISAEMIRQEFNKKDLDSPKNTIRENLSTIKKLMLDQSSDDAWGVVVPFPSRSERKRA